MALRFTDQLVHFMALLLWVGDLGCGFDQRCFFLLARIQSRTHLASTGEQPASPGAGVARWPAAATGEPDGHN
ncbi:hypothetical protein [Synechococcus sp. BS55D]|uniref:hypothetical protein n=1 Tax=Synechococcus sp. BS55D TaxID=2055943 RepID=UPI001F19DC52|nr:hypothetical protein [Synechococcus sp. BS55D]